MSRATRAYMRLYIDDYEADTGHLSKEADGIYGACIRAYWRQGGPLPNNDEALMRLTRSTPDEWRRSWPRVLPFFIADGSMLRHKRVDFELKVSAKAHAQKKDAAAARHGRKKKAQVTPIRSDIDTDDDSTGSDG